MSLFHCFNPACGRGFNTSSGVQQHMRQNVICAKYAAKTIMCASSDESDSDTDRISLEVVGENNNKH